MKLFNTYLYLSLIFALGIQAQTPIEKLEKEFEYTFVSGGGVNASSVCWYPDKKIFVTLMAGNADYPLEGFTEQGQNVFSSRTSLDARGIWYNLITRTIDLNLPGDGEWHSISFGRDLKTHSTKKLNVELYQPDFQSVATYNPDKRRVVYLDVKAKCIRLFDYRDPTKTEAIKLKKLADKNIAENYNQTSIGYTGIKDYEYILLHLTQKKLIFVNKDGEQTAAIATPEGVELPVAFKFSYANKRVFFFNEKNRTWTAYRLFK